MRLPCIILAIVCLVISPGLRAQQKNASLSPSDTHTELLVNGNFEDINTCTEYNSECGVEGWFYLKDVKAQMLSNDEQVNGLGKNSFNIYYNWKLDPNFVPVLGTVIPCHLQRGHQYTFKGMLLAKLNARLIFKPGVALGEFYYVPGRPFSRGMKADTIQDIKRMPGSDFYAFSYGFTATGDESYLTFGSFIEQDSTGGKKDLLGVQTVSLIMDNFSLTPQDPDEVACPAFDEMKRSIYAFDYRHKQMDYPLYGKGRLDLKVPPMDSSFVTTAKLVPPIKARMDTLRLSDISFDFNRADLKPAAKQMLDKFFGQSTLAAIDSISVEGHTDAVGNQEKNLELSRQRCESVKTWLMRNKGLSPETLHIIPFGKSRPVDTNETIAGRAKNRRVELIIFWRAR